MTFYDDYNGILRNLRYCLCMFHCIYALRNILSSPQQPVSNSAPQNIVNFNNQVGLRKLFLRFYFSFELNLIIMAKRKCKFHELTLMNSYAEM